VTTFLIILGWTCFVLAVLVGLALDLLGLFGNWVILGALVTLWAATGFDHFGLWAIAGFVGLAVLGEIVEAAAAGIGARKFGAGKGAMVAAIAGCVVGSVVGTPLLPIIGTLAGACLGAFIGAVSYQLVVMEKQTSGALWTGLGASLGMVAGLVAKLIVGFAMLLLAALTY